MCQSARCAFSALTFALLFILCAGLPGQVMGQQSIYMHHNQRLQVGVEYLRPSFGGDIFGSFSTTSPEINALSSVWFVSGRIPVTTRLAILLDIPVSYIEVATADAISEGTLGNPFIGIEYAPPSSYMYAQIGARAPVLSSDGSFGNIQASAYGIYADITRTDAFLYDVIPVMVKVGFRNTHLNGIYTNILVGGVGVLPTTDGLDNEIFVVYNALIGYDTQLLRIALGASGLWLATEEDVEFSEAFTNHLVLHFSAAVNNIRPGLIVRAPVSGDTFYTELLDAVFGFTLAIDLN